MKDQDIKKSFINRFITLEGNYFTDGYKNVNFNKNVKFEIPSNKMFFQIALVTDAPESIGIVNNGENERYTGFFQIDVCVPLNSGTKKVDEITDKLSKLFRAGTTFDDVIVNKVYKASESYEDTYYKQVIRINFDADIINE